MKPLATLLVLLIPAAALAQEGTVRYEQTVKMEVELPPEMAHMKDQFPTIRTASRLLHFNESASLMVEVAEAAPEEEEAESGGLRVRISMSGGNEAVYTDFDEDQVVERREFLGRMFRITGEREGLAWRLTDEQSEFLGYLCRKAVAMRDTVAVEAWFTSEIPVPAGPGRYGGLPGLILVLTEDEGRVSYVAKEVSLETVPEGTIAAPDEGREVSRDEFDAIVEEKLKEMGAERRGGATLMIRRQN